MTHSTDSHYLPVTYRHRARSGKTSTRTKRGLLVALEGIDGSGKTTVTKQLANRFRRRGFSVAVFRGSSDFTLYWQAVVAAKKNLAQTGHPLPPEIDQSLHTFEFLAYARYRLPELLARHDIVIADRYLLGRIALVRWDTGRAGSIPERIIADFMERKLVPRAEVILYLNLSPHDARLRIEARGHAPEEKEKIGNLMAIAGRFRALIAKPPFSGRVGILDASKPAEETIRAAELAISKKLRGK